MTKEETELVFVVANGMRLFALGGLIAFNKVVERGERTVEVLGKAVRRIRAVKRTGKDADGRLHIFADIDRKGRKEVLVEISESHNDLSLQEFFSAHETT
jgi:hypothetical protein